MGTRTVPVITPFTDRDELPFYLTVREVAIHGRCSERTIRNLIEQGKLEASRLGKLIRIPRTAIEHEEADNA